ncbi:hypothetical protein C8Q75DRAFT_94188 [Abortiporus biennis]|nr:hypothetical protein C8Q75DRAFT_94188 [Abortiporus biennis]
MPFSRLLPVCTISYVPLVSLEYFPNATHCSSFSHFHLWNDTSEPVIAESGKTLAATVVTVSTCNFLKNLKKTKRISSLLFCLLFNMNLLGPTAQSA